MSPGKGGLGRRPGRRALCRQKKVTTTSATSISYIQDRIVNTAVVQLNIKLPRKVTVVFGNERVVCYPLSLKDKEGGVIKTIVGGNCCFPKTVRVVYSDNNIVCLPGNISNDIVQKKGVDAAKKRFNDDEEILKQKILKTNTIHVKLNTDLEKKSKQIDKLKSIIKLLTTD